MNRGNGARCNSTTAEQHDNPSQVVEIARGEAPRKRFEFKMLAGDIAYIALDHFENDAGVKAFEAALPDIMKAKGLIIDVRDNGGGSNMYGLQVLSYLAAGPIAVAK